MVTVARENGLTARKDVRPGSGFNLFELAFESLRDRGSFEAGFDLYVIDLETLEVERLTRP